MYILQKNNYIKIIWWLYYHFISDCNILFLLSLLCILTYIDVISDQQRIVFHQEQWKSFLHQFFLFLFPFLLSLE